MFSYSSQMCEWWRVLRWNMCLWVMMLYILDSMLNIYFSNFVSISFSSYKFILKTNKQNTIFLLFDIDVLEKASLLWFDFLWMWKSHWSKLTFFVKKKTRRWKVLAGWAAPHRVFVAHTTHLLHFGMYFQLTKEARVSTDPHNWHTKSGEKTNHGNHLLSSLKLVLIFFVSKREHF